MSRSQKDSSTICRRGWEDTLVRPVVHFSKTDTGRERPTVPRFKKTYLSIYLSIYPGPCQIFGPHELSKSTRSLSDLAQGIEGTEGQEASHQERSQLSPTKAEQAAA